MPDKQMSGYQLPLQIQLNDNATFANFFLADNAQAVELLRSDEAFVYLWSSVATGKTHLLQSICHETPRCIYLPLTDYEDWHPSMFEGLEEYAVVCLDDIHLIAGDADWELALFGLFNRIRDTQHRLIVTANCSPAILGIRLPDLASRLSWGVSLRMQEMSDEQKVQALAMRADLRGFKMSSDVASYLLKHCPRDLHTLFAILDKLDNASLQAQRRITQPFIRDCLQGKTV
jgi:DnaA family protein